MAEGHLRRHDQRVPPFLQSDELDLAHGAWSFSGRGTAPLLVQRLIIVTSLPVALNCTSSMKVRIRSSPLPLTRSRLAGSVGSGRLAGSKPGPSSRTTNVPPVRDSRTLTYSRRSRHGEADSRSASNSAYASGSPSRTSELISRLPWNIALRSDSSRAMHTRITSESSHRPTLVAIRCT